MRATRVQNINGNKKDFSPEQREELLGALKARFEKNMNRHEGLEWAKVQAKLEANAEKLWSLNEMERTGGEPDVGFLTGVVNTLITEIGVDRDHVLRPAFPVAVIWRFVLRSKLLPAFAQLRR
jgi:hypothetical protein